MLTEAIASFITRDMRPVNVVDGTGFLKLMQVAEPRYVVPCRKTIMKVIDQQYLSLRHNVHAELAQQNLCLLLQICGLPKEVMAIYITYLPFSDFRFSNVSQKSHNSTLTWNTLPYQYCRSC